MNGPDTDEKRNQSRTQDTFSTKKYAITNARGNVAKEPAVPGALGDNPEPKNVAIMRANLFNII